MARLGRGQPFKFKIKRPTPFNIGSFATVSGTITSSVTEADIVTGGKTIIITLTNDTWITAGAPFNAQRQTILDNLNSAQSEPLGWDAWIAIHNLATVVRTSDTVVTITLDPIADYNITAQETITVTAPSSAVTSGVSMVASPTFTIDTGGAAATVRDIIMMGMIPFARA